jgi:hypothetical protein
MESAWTTTSSFARDDETSDTSSMVFTEIQRQIQSKNQVMLTADATSKTYQIKIKSLEEFIKNLQNELAVSIFD